ncbi:MAG: hypothetical protein VX038_01350 [Verrucomicrobiota bacterium]|nr:hypothetical protein [Verrucomicrobiota bacterium]
MQKLLVLALAFPFIGFSSHREKCYQNFFAKRINGTTEVLMPDNTRCDILTENLAIEVDFAPKWAEAIGQSLHYAKMVNRQAGIVIVIRKKIDHFHVKKLWGVIQEYNLPIQVFQLEVKDLAVCNEYCL